MPNSGRQSLDGNGEPKTSRVSMSMRPRSEPADDSLPDRHSCPSLACRHQAFFTCHCFSPRCIRGGTTLRPLVLPAVFLQRHGLHDPPSPPAPSPSFSWLTNVKLSSTTPHRPVLDLRHHCGHAADAAPQRLLLHPSAAAAAPQPFCHGDGPGQPTAGTATLYLRPPVQDILSSTSL